MLNTATNEYRDKCKKRKSERTFIRSFFTKLKFLWELLGAFAVTTAYLLILYMQTRSDDSLMRNGLQACNDTSRVIFIGFAGVTFHQYFG